MKTKALAAVFIGVFISGTVHAQWLGSATNNANYNDSANWNNSIISDQFIPVSGSAYGWASAYNINFSGTCVLPGDFVYNNADTVAFTITPTNGSVWRFASNNPMIRIVDVGGTATRGVNFSIGVASRSFTLDLQGKDLTYAVNENQLSLGGNGRDIVYNYATIADARTSTKPEAAGCC